MTPAPTAIPPFPLLRACGSLTLVAGGGAAVVGLLAVVARWPDRPGVALATLGVCFLAAVAALEPVRRAARYGIQRVTLVTLLTFPVRLALAALGAVLLVRLFDWPVAPVAVWMLVWYLVFLCVEVAVIVQYLAAATTPAGARPHAAPLPARRLAHPEGN